MGGWKCFLLRESSICRRELRRYAEGPCSLGFHLHDVIVVIDPEISGLEEGAFLEGDFKSDPRWPVQCLCGRPFTPTDHWQVHVHRLYHGAPDQKLYAIHDKDLPPGAIWEEPWRAKRGWVGPDGRSYMVRLPTRVNFPIDEAAADGGRWTRSGTPPHLTVEPSIHEVGRYHGHLKSGILSACVDGNRFVDFPETA